MEKTQTLPKDNRFVGQQGGNTHAVLVTQTYFDICNAYRLTPFICHTAVALRLLLPNDRFQKVLSVDAACFSIAQKLHVTNSIDVFNLSEIFGIPSPNALVLAERQIFPLVFQLEDACPARTVIARTEGMTAQLRENVVSFFHLSLFGAMLLLPLPLLSFPVLKKAPIDTLALAFFSLLCARAYPFTDLLCFLFFSYPLLCTA